MSMITAIIVNYFCSNLTLRAVESVLSEDKDAEIFVVDNSANSDEAQQLTQLLPRHVNLIINETNDGFARACNKAYQLSCGDEILLLNPDAYLLSGALNHLKQALLTCPQAGAVGPKIYWDDSKRFYLPPSLFPSPWLSLRNELWRLHPILGQLHSFLLRRDALKVWTSNKQFIATSALSGGHLLIKRSAINNCGGLFNDYYFMYFEDSDLMLRLKKANYRLYIIPSAECVHNYEHNYQKLQLMDDSIKYYFNSNFANSFLLKLIKWLPDRQSPSLPNSLVDLGKIDSPPILNVPESLHSDWLLEISHSLFYTPAIGLLGNGEVAEIPTTCFQWLHSGVYFCRISSTGSIPRHIKQWRWEKI